MGRNSVPILQSINLTFIIDEGGVSWRTNLKGEPWIVPGSADGEDHPFPRFRDLDRIDCLEQRRLKYALEYT